MQNQNSQKKRIFFNRKIIEDCKCEYINLIYRIKNNQEFKKQLYPVWRLFTKSINGQIYIKDLHKYLTVVLYFLLPYLPQFYCQKIAEDEIQNLINNSQETLGFDLFSELYAKLAFKWVENVDLKSAIEFVNLTFQRTTRLEVANIDDISDKILIDFKIEVKLYNNDKIKLTGKQPDQRLLIFYEESIKYDKNQVLKYSDDYQYDVKYQIIPYENIIPLGFSGESLLQSLRNNNFEPKGNFFNMSSNKNPNLQKIQIVPVLEEGFIQTFQRLTKSNEELSQIGIISTHETSDAASPIEATYKINTLSKRPLYFEELKTKKGERCYQNVLSQFENEGFDIDQIDYLQKKMKQKKDLKDNQSIGQSQLNKRKKKEQIDFELVSRTLNYDLLINIFNSTTSISLQKSLKTVFDPNEGVFKRWNFDEYTSKYNKLPSDTLDPFNSDIIKYANSRPLQILLLGKPKIGKTTFCQNFAKRLNIVHIEIGQLIDNCLKALQEDAPELNEEGVGISTLPQAFQDVKKYLEEGQSLPNILLLELVNIELRKDEVITNGYILDIPLNQSSKEFSWIDSIISNRVQLPKIGCRYISHLVELNHSDEDVRLFKNGLMESPETGVLYSQFQRDQLRKPKIKVEGEEEEQQEEEDDSKKPQHEKDLVFRINEDDEWINEQLNIYKNFTKKKILEFHNHLTHNEHIIIQAAGLSPEEITKIAIQRLADEVQPLRPIAIKLEGGSEKDQLGFGLEEQKMYRQWSPWQQIDPVELFNGKVVTGKGDLACGYAGRVFLFDNENNQKLFLNQPRKYLQKKPELPKTYNIAIIGPRKSGKKTMANLLVNEYGWTKLDVEEIIGSKIQWQRSLETQIPSNFESRVNDVHFSDPEWKEIMKGKEVKPSEIWPIIFHLLGKPLQKKPEGWGVEKKEEDEDEEEKKRKEEEEKKKNIKKQTKKKETKDVKKDEEDERPKTPVVEDLPLKEIIQLVGPDGKIPPVLGLLIIGQPLTEEQLNMLKYHNIQLDKVLILMDMDEEDPPGRTLMKRPGFDENHIQETEMAMIKTAAAVLKEQIGEENVKEVSIEGSIKDVYNRIRTLIDPFFIRCDDEAMVRVTGDVNEEEDDPIQWGEYGPFCPVTFKDDNWLLIGKGEFEAYVQGRRHRFFTQADQVAFKDHIVDYVEGQQLKVPPPRIMISGAKGSGVHTQLTQLYHKYKIPILEFKQNLLNLLSNEKDKRRNDRYYLKGFKAPEFDEEGNKIEDGEIENDAEDFDRAAHEIDMTSKVFKDVQGLLINGNFFLEGIEENECTTGLKELLEASKRLPEVFIYLKVSEAEFLQRKFDENAVKKERRAIIDKLKDERRVQREEALRQKRLEAAELAAGEDGEKVAVEEEEEVFADDTDEEWPKEADMINERKEKLITQRTNEVEKLEALREQFQELGINIIEIDADRANDKVFDQICYNLSPYLEKRENLLEKYMAWEFKRPVAEIADEEEKPDRLIYYEQSYNFKKSRYHDRNPLNLFDVPRCREYPLIYRNRIYYFQSRTELEMVKMEPLKYLVNKTFPIDINIKPSIFVIGKSHSGKSSLCKLLEQKLQMVRIKPSMILEDYLIDHPSLTSNMVLEQLRSGQTVTDDLMSELIYQRSQMADCLENGWVLDGYPKNRQQAQSLADRGMIPHVVFYISLDIYHINSRSKNVSKSKFGYKSEIQHSKIKNESIDLLDLSNYYNENYNNIFVLGSKISRWGIYEQAKSIILQGVMQRQEFARSRITNYPVCIGRMCLTPKDIISNLSLFENYSPVSIKSIRQFVKNELLSPFLVYYDKYMYVLDSENEVQDFINRPDLYIYQKIDKMEIAQKIQMSSLADSQSKVALKGYCVESLYQGKLVKGQPSVLVEYNGVIYSFSSSKKMNLFMSNPVKYQNVELYDKLPVEFDKRNLVKKVAKKGQCTAYLEHYLGQSVMKVLAQLGYKRLKYPSINCKETALKFIAISLKASNVNQTQEYCDKYKHKLQLFLKHCSYSTEIREENQRKMDSPSNWEQWDEENLLKVTAEFYAFMKEFKNTENDAHFAQFIR